MDKKEIKKNLSIIIAVITFLSLVIICIILYIPLIKKNIELSSQLNGLNRELVKARGIQDSLAGGHDIKELLVKEDVQYVINRIAKQEVPGKLKFVSIVPAQMLEIDNCKIIPLVLDIESDFMSIGEFFETIGMLDKGFVTVDSFKLATVVKDGNSGKLKAILVLNIYIKG